MQNAAFIHFMYQNSVQENAKKATFNHSVMVNNNQTKQKKNRQVEETQSPSHFWKNTNRMYAGVCVARKKKSD
jgi:hypothetical protein